MKIRIDFVTNSSSSSFIIAREEELSEQLKEMIITFVLDEMMGEKLLSPGMERRNTFQPFFHSLFFIALLSP